MYDIHTTALYGCNVQHPCTGSVPPVPDLNKPTLTINRLFYLVRLMRVRSRYRVRGALLAVASAVWSLTCRLYKFVYIISYHIQHTAYIKHYEFVYDPIAINI